MRWPRILADRIGVEYPVLQAPMAGGPSTPELTAAVSNAGGLGSFAGGYLAPEAIRDAIRKIRTLTSRPFAVNLFAPVPAGLPPSADDLARAREAVAPFRAEVGLGDAGTPGPL